MPGPRVEAARRRPQSKRDINGTEAGPLRRPSPWPDPSRKRGDPKLGGGL